MKTATLTTEALIPIDEMPANTTKPLAMNGWAPDDRPREKLLLKGAPSLSDAELLAILIGSGSAKLNALDLARCVLAKVGNDLNKLAKLNAYELREICGLGFAKALNVIAAIELGRRRQPDDVSQQTTITSARVAYDMMKPFLADLRKEEFWVLILNRRNVVIDKIQISIGGVSGTLADPKVIFKAALERLGSAIILMHNHPSGNLKPSVADENLTWKMRDGSKLLDIALLDHIIYTDCGYYSFAEEGRL